MRRLNWNVRRDAAERPILQALERAGAECWQLSGTGCPDLLVRFRGQLYAGEVKSKGGRLTASQGAFDVWRTPEEALRAIGALQAAGGQGPALQSPPMKLTRQRDGNFRIEEA